MALIGGKWKVQILCAVTNAGAIRYNALRARLDGISNTVLASAAARGSRPSGCTPRARAPPDTRVEYSPTDDCRALLPILDQLSDWAEARM